jgi:hypothetical protein
MSRTVGETRNYKLKAGLYNHALKAAGGHALDFSTAAVYTFGTPVARVDLSCRPVAPPRHWQRYTTV